MASKKVLPPSSLSKFFIGIWKEWYIGYSLGVIMVGATGWLGFMSYRSLFNHNELVWTWDSASSWATKGNLGEQIKLVDRQTATSWNDEREARLIGKKL